jgi:hypothetical protein
VALKRIPKKLASREDFQREMEALLRIQKWGGHPHICALREHFDEGGYYYLILDLIEGGESELLCWLWDIVMFFVWDVFGCQYVDCLYWSDVAIMNMVVYLTPFFLSV